MTSTSCTRSCRRDLVRHLRCHSALLPSTSRSPPTAHSPPSPPTAASTAAGTVPSRRTAGSQVLRGEPAPPSATKLRDAGPGSQPVEQGPAAGPSVLFRDRLGHRLDPQPGDRLAGPLRRRARRRPLDRHPGAPHPGPAGRTGGPAPSHGPGVPRSEPPAEWRWPAGAPWWGGTAALPGHLPPWRVFDRVGMARTRPIRARPPRAAAWPARTLALVRRPASAGRAGIARSGSLTGRLRGWRIAVPDAKPPSPKPPRGRAGTHPRPPPAASGWPFAAPATPSPPSRPLPPPSPS